MDSSGTRRRPQMVTSAPAFASASAIAAPMPVPPPVTIACLPASVVIVEVSDSSFRGRAKPGARNRYSLTCDYGFRTRRGACHRAGHFGPDPLAAIRNDGAGSFASSSRASRRLLGAAGEPVELIAAGQVRLRPSLAAVAELR